MRLPTKYDDDDFCRIEARNTRDASMDVVCYSPTGEEYLLDASVHKPLAQRYAIAALSRPGFAASCGERHKLRHYPTTSSKNVLLARFAESFELCQLRLM